MHGGTAFLNMSPLGWNTIIHLLSISPLPPPLLLIHIGRAWGGGEELPAHGPTGTTTCWPASQPSSPTLPSSTGVGPGDLRFQAWRGGGHWPASPRSTSASPTSLNLCQRTAGAAAVPWHGAYQHGRPGSPAPPLLLLLLSSSSASFCFCSLTSSTKASFLYPPGRLTSSRRSSTSWRKVTKLQVEARISPGTAEQQEAQRAAASGDAEGAEATRHIPK